MRMGKKRVIAETGAGQHGVATATACALFGLECTVYMGEEDIRRQKLNVFNMKTLGATVVSVTTGSRTLRDATNEAMRDWMGSSATTHYTIGSVVGPHPFPMIVRDFQSVIGRETREQCLEQVGRLPDMVVACVGGGSNAAGIFAPFIDDIEVALVGAEAGGRGGQPGEHAASLSQGSPGVLHGSYSYVLQDEDGQTSNVHSISAGLDYPGVGPEHSYWKEIGRARYESITDAEALDAYNVTARHEGILPALESSHAVAQAFKEAARLGPGKVLVVCLSGRGDKDAYEVARLAAVETASDMKSRIRIDHLCSPGSGARNAARSCRSSPPAIPISRPPRLLISELVKSGAHLLEIGIPYSDPIADGPVIAASYHRALEGRRQGRPHLPDAPHAPCRGHATVQRDAACRHGLLRDRPSSRCRAVLE